MDQSAFPIPNDDRPGAYPAEPGMSLRDYFAAKAMHGFISEPVDGVQEAMFFELSDQTCDQVAKSAYSMADAMLRARAG
jgi:hypothetical protein